MVWGTNNLMHENDDGRGRFWRVSIPNVNLLEMKKSISYNIIFNPNLQRNVLSCFDWPGASSHFGCNCNRGSFSRGRQQRSVRVAFPRPSHSHSICRCSVVVCGQSEPHIPRRNATNHCWGAHNHPSHRSRRPSFIAAWTD